ncbi:MAG: type secretion system protein VirJ [Verrucomicrobiaceae bacterium]|nr:type secretion system protein VirJ [Verrucomicrobiaceae bacterium]
MRLPCLLFMSLLTVSTLVAAAQPRIDIDDFADLGRVSIVIPEQVPQDLVLLLDDSDHTALATTLATRGHLVALMPLRNLLDNTRKNKDSCLYPVTLLDVFSQHLQEKYHFAHYQKPVLIGTGAAAATAYATLAQAPTRLFRAGIGLDFCPLLSQPVPPCKGDGAFSWDTLGPQQYRLKPVALDTPWHALGACADAKSFGPILEKQADLSAQIDTLLRPAVAETGGKNIAIDDLPLVELPAAASQNDYFVVLLSGDGGWANIDKDIGSQLNHQGIPVVGWNTLQYFWSRKTPATIGADLQRVISHYQTSWNKKRVVLVGFSFGADVLPFMVSRLPATQRQAVSSIALLSLSHSVDFQFHVANWFSHASTDSNAIAPELAKITEPVLCLYGKDDDDTLCAETKAPNVTRAMLPGDHHFDGDFKTVSRLILEHLAKTRNTAASGH